MRYKEFNRNRVLEKCIPLFWEKGFRGCAISEIVEITGVNRFSLYDEFENKEGILEAALHLYKERYCTDRLGLLSADGEVEKVLEQFYMAYIDPANDGCFIMHIGTELADTNEQVRTFLRNYLNEIEAQLVQLLSRDATLNEHRESIARNLIGLFCTAISFCLIKTEKERIDHVKNGISIILSKKMSYA